MSKIFTASLLVAGTAIGAGMLALPISTAAGGFWPAIAIYFVCWLFSACTGVLLLEACLWLPKDSNIVSLSQHLLGKKGRFLSWILYLFLFYSLTIAYAALGGGFIDSVFKGSLSPEISILLFILLFSPVVYIGTRAVDRFNAVLMGGLIVSFFAFIFIAIGKVDTSRLQMVHWPSAILALPIVFASFSYQGIIPSLRTYFEGRPKQARKVIVIGSSIPFLVYVVWQYLIQGIVPLEGLNEAKQEGLSAVVPLRDYANLPIAYVIGQGFAFFAMTTSFLGVTLGIFDFLADGLKVQKKGKGKALLYFLVFGPPAVIAMLNPKIFVKALGYAGGIGCALLLGLFPVLMVWSGRYKKNLDSKNQMLKGGKALLLLLAGVVIFEVIVELIKEFI